MLKLAIRTLGACCLAALLCAAPAAGDPGTTGGVAAGEPPLLSPEGGVQGPAGAPEALAAQSGEEPSGGGESPTATIPTPTVPDPAPDEGDSQVESAATPPSSSAAPASDPEPSGGSGLPRTGFAVAALVALGTGFFLTGYALRYSRTLDG